MMSRGNSNLLKPGLHALFLEKCLFFHDADEPEKVPDSAAGFPSLRDLRRWGIFPESLLFVVATCEIGFEESISSATG